MAAKKGKNQKADKKIGRPTIYTEELANTIVDRLAKGETLEQICKDEDMPGITAVFDWIDKKKGFAKAYSRARKKQAVVFIDNIKKDLDNTAVMAAQCDETVGASSKVKAVVEAQKLRAGFYQWMAAKYNKKFSEHSSSTVKQKTQLSVNTSETVADRINRLADLAEQKSTINNTSEKTK